MKIGDKVRVISDTYGQLGDTGTIVKFYDGAGMCDVSVDGDTEYGNGYGWHYSFKELELLEQPVIIPDTETITYRNAVKKDAGKARMELIDPDFLLEVAQGLTFGATKYSDYNYMENGGLEYSRLYASAQRHLLEFYKGIDRDEESDVDHLAASTVNLMMLYVLKKKGLGKDDRKFKVDKDDD